LLMNDIYFLPGPKKNLVKFIIYSDALTLAATSAGTQDSHSE
jgi:hypothetical protein